MLANRGAIVSQFALSLWNPKMIPRVCLQPLIAFGGMWLATFVTDSNCWAQKTLAWKFKKDGVTNVVVEQDTSLQLEMPAATSANQTQTLQTTNITWTVKELAPDGLASIEQTINRVQLQVKSSAGNFLIDTNNSQPLTGLAESMAKGIRPLAGCRFVVRTKPSGEVAEVIIPQDVSKSLNELSTAGLREIAANGSLKFPNKAIDVGESWPAQYELEMPPFGKLIVSTNYQYLGEEILDGKKLDRIKATTAVKAANGTANAGLKLKSQEATGLIWFDNTRGSIDHSEFKQEMSMSVTIPGPDPSKASVETKQNMKQIMKLKYSPQL